MDNYLKKVIFYTLAIALCLSGLSFVIFKSSDIALGFMIGAIARLAGLNSINNMAKRIDGTTNGKTKGMANYFVRLLFYGIVIWISITRGINVFSLLGGFVIMNVVIIITSYRKGGYE